MSDMGVFAAKLAELLKGTTEYQAHLLLKSASLIMLERSRLLAAPPDTRRVARWVKA